LLLDELHALLQISLLLLERCDLRDFLVQLGDPGLQKVVARVLLLDAVVQHPATCENEHDTEHEHTCQVTEKFLFPALAFPLAPG
jgi:hypothetical protein